MVAGGLPQPGRSTTPGLLANVLVVSVCGLIYELVAGTLASYLLGDAVQAFCVLLGVYLSAMGVGAWCSGRLRGDLAATFIAVEIALALVGGCTAPVLLAAFAHTHVFRAVLCAYVALVGALVGVELPVLIRLLQSDTNFRERVSQSLAADYLGGLVAAVLYPLVLVPFAGLVRTSLLAGLGNAAVALASTWLLTPERPSRATLRVGAVAVVAVLVAALVCAAPITALGGD